VPSDATDEITDEQYAHGLPGVHGSDLPDTPAALTPEPPRVIVPRWVQLVVLPLALVALWELAHAAGKLLLVFVIAGVIALILNPAWHSSSARGCPAGWRCSRWYVAFFLILAGIGVLLANPISNQVRTFTHNLPHLVNEANSTIVGFQGDLNRLGFHVQFAEQGKTALQTVSDKLTKSAGSVVSFGGSLLSEAALAFIDLVLVFVLSVYMLIYGQRIGTLAPQGHARRRRNARG